MNLISRYRRLIFAGLLLLATPACTTLTTVQGLCGSPPNQGACIGQMRVPERSATEYVAASRQAIDTVASPGFRTALSEFIRDHARTGDHASAWGKLDADTAISWLLRGFAGVSIDTMGDAEGFVKNLVFGTKAKEGSDDGPILVNPVYRGTSADYANTITHEAAHRAPLRLSHPNYDGNTKDVGLCEPPYVMGSLVERQLIGRLDPGFHCELLKR